MRILLLTPPMTQLNTAYPATAYLTGFLRSQERTVEQADVSLELALRILSRDGITRIASQLGLESELKPYANTVDAVVRFLQGRDPTLAIRIVSREFLPEGSKFDVINGLEDGLGSLDWAFGDLGIQDRAKYLASLYIEDIIDLVRERIDPRFEISRYGEKLAASAPTFDPLVTALEAKPTLIDCFLEEIISELMDQHQPDLVGMSAPFPGNVYGAFRMAQWIKKNHPNVHLVLGGGFVNTELRELKEPKVFDFFDFFTLDDGEKPFLLVLDHLAGKIPSSRLLRTFVREQGKVILKSSPVEHDIPHRETGIPTMDGLKTDRYLSIFEMLNPMHRIWSDGRWNKITLAHGCYWKKCNFCDITLDYIGRYEPATASLSVDRMEAMIAETGQSGFHLVDEAAPPAGLRSLAQEILRRELSVTWWGNVRFDKAFTPELVQSLAQSGCVAVSGGLEVASDRLLKLMQKGVTVEQVARVTYAFTQAGIMVHAYLMYGFPTQTVQETIDALERVRQLFAAGCIQSAYWHRFSATAHSPIGKDPSRFGIQLLPEPPVTFARNDLPFVDPTGVDHDRLGVGLRKALYNYMHGVGLDQDVRKWFEFKVPKTSVAPGLIDSFLG